jgi:hypothetical protein
MSLKLFGIQISRWSQAAESAFSKGMRLVRTDCTDEEIRDEIINAAHGEASVVREALTQVEDMRRDQQSYVTDRAFRVFAAAAQNEPVAPVDLANVELFERERRLEKLPLDTAMAELCELSPTLKRYCEDVPRQEEKQYEKASWRRLISIEHEMEREIDFLVGPEADVLEPLLRSPISAGVVMSWTREATGLAAAIKQLTEDS